MEGRRAAKAHTERIYVKVTSEFDTTGSMVPLSITWADGRTFAIEAVRDFRPAGAVGNDRAGDCFTVLIQGREDRKSTRLNSSHVSISYAVFCLKKKNNAATATW